MFGYRRSDAISRVMRGGGHPQKRDWRIVFPWACRAKGAKIAKTCNQLQPDEITPALYLRTAYFGSVRKPHDRGKEVRF